MDKKQQRVILIALLAVILAGCLVYVPYFGRLGLYRDDWNNFYTATVKGPDAMVQHYASDRPADGYLIGFLFRIFGTNLIAWFVYNFICRLIGTLCLTLTLFRLWPENEVLNTVAGILLILFPGFLQQIDGIAYAPHQTAMMCFFISLYLTTAALQSEKPILSTVFAVITAVISPVLMEYYIGMEIYRLGLIFIVMRRRHPLKKTLLQTIRAYLPFLGGLGLFLIWRVLIYKPTRAGTDVMNEVIIPLLQHPKYNGLPILKRLAENILQLFWGAWVRCFSNAKGSFAVWSTSKTIRNSILATVVLAAFLILLKRRSDKDAAPKWIWLIFGLLCGVIVLLPMVMAGRDITYVFSLDRFSWPGALASVLFILGLVGLIPFGNLRVLLSVGLVFISAFVQLHNGNRYAGMWSESRDYWQQMIWRVPGIRDEALLLSSDGLVTVEEDYEIFAPANMIYYPDQTEHPEFVPNDRTYYVEGTKRVPVSAEVLNDGTVEKVENGDYTERLVRGIWTTKEFSKIMALSKPSPQSCLHVINGENPIYSEFEWSRIPKVGAYSDWDLILPENTAHFAYPFFLPEEQDHNWCYYYEKAELAMQFGDTEEAVRLADEAADLGFAAGDSVEWVPFTEAYTESGRAEDALPYVERMKDLPGACDYFRNKENPAYDAVLGILCEGTGR